MKRPASSPAPLRSSRAPRGYTMIEILMATLLTLILLFAVVSIFASISGSINDSRATLEMTDRLRASAARMQEDLKHLTVTMLPPRRPEEDEGYFEYMERLVGPGGVNIDTGLADSTVGDYDDILMFTTRSPKNPFIGRFGAGTIESHVAEVMWFVRGRTLYRRVLLVAPKCIRALDTDGNQYIDAGEWPGGGSFFMACDISVHREQDASGTIHLKPNTLGDLTKPENRYAHQSGGFPFHPHRVNGWFQLGLPTLSESSSAGFTDWFNSGLPAVPLTARGTFDAWANPYPFNELDAEVGTIETYNSTRVAEDVILTNVVGFDVKAWDPNAPVYSNGTIALMPGDPGYAAAMGGTPVSYGAYVDLNYASGTIDTPFAGPGQLSPMLSGVYDTWSFHYENDGVDQLGNGTLDTGTDGFDNDGNGVVDDAAEMEAPAPYPVPLRGIQIKIRAYEADSRQVREVTVVQDFLPK